MTPLQIVKRQMNRENPHQKRQQHGVDSLRSFDDIFGSSSSSSSSSFSDNFVLLDLVSSGRLVPVLADTDFPGNDMGRGGDGRGGGRNGVSNPAESAVGCADKCAER